MAIIDLDKDDPRNAKFIGIASTHDGECIPLFARQVDDKVHVYSLSIEALAVLAGMLTIRGIGYDDRQDRELIRGLQAPLTKTEPVFRLGENGALFQNGVLVAKPSSVSCLHPVTYFGIAETGAEIVRGYKDTPLDLYWKNLLKPNRAAAPLPEMTEAEKDALHRFMADGVISEDIFPLARRVAAFELARGDDLPVVRRRSLAGLINRLKTHGEYPEEASTQGAARPSGSIPSQPGYIQVPQA